MDSFASNFLESEQQASRKGETVAIKIYTFHYSFMIGGWGLQDLVCYDSWFILQAAQKFFRMKYT